MENLISGWKPGKSPIRAPGAGDNSRGKNPKGVNSTREDSSLSSISEDPSCAIPPGTSQAGSIRPLPAHKNPGHARPGKSREDPSESAIQPPAGAALQQAVYSDEPYILLNDAEEYIVAQKIPGLVGLNGSNNFGPLASLVYTIAPKETTEQSKYGIAREIARGIIPTLQINYSEATPEFLVDAHRGSQSSMSSSLAEAAIADTFTNYSARRTDTATGDLIIEFCLDTLKSTAHGATPSGVLTPREKMNIFLGKGEDGIERRGIVERVSVSLRRLSVPQPHDFWELSIFVPDKLGSKSLTEWSNLEAKLESGSRWTKLAIRDPRRLVLEIVRKQLSWKGLSMELREEVSLTCMDVLDGPMTDAIKVLHKELNLLQDCELSLESNLNFIVSLQADLSNTARSQLVEDDQVLAEFQSIGAALKQKLLFLKQLKEEVATTIDMIFNAVQVDQSIQALKEGVLVYEQAESMRRLTYLTVFFLPATFIATIFGMNSPSTASPPLWLFFATSVPLSIMSFGILFGMRYIPEIKDQVLSALSSKQQRPFEFDTASISGNAKANPQLGTRAKRTFGFQSIVPFRRGTTHHSDIVLHTSNGPPKPQRRPTVAAEMPHPAAPQRRPTVAAEMPHPEAPHRLPPPRLASAEEPLAVELPAAAGAGDARTPKRHPGAHQLATSAQRIRQRLLASANNPGRPGTDGEQVPPLILPPLGRRTGVSTRRHSATQPSFNDRYEWRVEFRPDGYGHGSSSRSTTANPTVGGFIPRPDHAQHSPAV